MKKPDCIEITNVTAVGNRKLIKSLGNLILHCNPKKTDRKGVGGRESKIFTMRTVQNKARELQCKLHVRKNERRQRTKTNKVKIWHANSKRKFEET